MQFNNIKFCCADADMSIMMVFPEEEVVEQMLLCAEDFPPDYVNFAHPQDYHVSSQPIEPECIFNHRQGTHNRLLWRVSWDIGNRKFMPMTFVLDTGAPKQMYLSQTALSKLEELGLLKTDEDTEARWVQLFGRKCGVERTPHGHDPANIIGLRMLMRLGLQLSDSVPFFKFLPTRNCLQST